jgi:hypothetical protein
VAATLIFLAALGSPPAPAPTPAGTPRYYFTLFAGQSVPFRPRTAHTWATWAKATPRADGTVAVESFTISWLPADASVEPYRGRPAAGRNFTLAETFAIMGRVNSRISMWGPYETDAERFRLAAEQARLLESGAIRYRTFDSFGRKHAVQHCVHAVTYADPRLKNRTQPVLQVGEPGTSRLARRYARTGAFVGGPVAHDWLVPAIGADQYPVVPRRPGEFIVRRWPRS